MIKKKRKFLNAAFLVDGYKLLHHTMYPNGTEIVFSNFTARSNKFATIKGANKVVVGAIQYVLCDLVDRFDREFFMLEERSWCESDEDLKQLKDGILSEIEKEFSMYTGIEFGMQHFSDLWDLGYLPIEIRTLDEGTACPIKVPYLTIHNTDKRFFWVTNYLETIISNMVWSGVTAATTARGMKMLVDKWALKTTGEKETDFQLHDFSMRGLKGVDNTIVSGISFLMSSLGTDNIPAIPMIRWAYEDEGFIAAGVPATEHSIMTSEGEEGEEQLFIDLMNKYPAGFLSIVSDSYNYFRVLDVYLRRLKNQIMGRNGRLVIRPDSGSVVDIICGTVKDIRPFIEKENLIGKLEDEYWEYFNNELEDDGYVDYAKDTIKVGDTFYQVEANAEIGKSHDHNDNDHYYIDEVTITLTEVDPTPEMKGSIEILWDIFGGTTNGLGYKELDNHIGLIYGESINYETAIKIFELLEIKGFASTNVVLGLGSYLFSMVSRDSYGQAIKSTYQEVDGVGKNIFKDPITDDGTKKSARGLLTVKNIEGDLTLFQEQTWEDIASDENLLRIRFKDGEFFNQESFDTIRKRTENANIF